MKMFAGSILALSVLAAACSSNDNSSTTLDDTSVQTAQFKLYDEPRVTPNPSCDLYTSLSLRNGAQGVEAFMVNRLGGTCELAVFPNERLYAALTMAVDGCGAKIYTGSRPRQEGGLDQVVITDNRTNRCEIVLPALVVVKETLARGEITYYSHDAAIADPTPAQSLVCTMNDRQARPYLTFLVDRAAGAEHASIRYIRSAFFGSEEVQFDAPVPGCEAENMHITEMSGREIYLECNADGDAGFLSVERPGRSLHYSGTMNFPNTGVEGYSDTSLDITCIPQ